MTVIRDAMIPKTGYLTSTGPDASKRGYLLSSLAWGIFLSIYFFAVYATCNAITAGRPDIGQVGFAWERFIPFVPPMILPYMSIDLFFFLRRFCVRAHPKEGPTPPGSSWLSRSPVPVS